MSRRGTLAIARVPLLLIGDRHLTTLAVPDDAIGAENCSHSTDNFSKVYNSQMTTLKSL
ncbi:MAG: hypothetical protein AAFU78_10530 [Cyanobacteria bacterium J06633_2]